MTPRDWGFFALGVVAAYAGLVVAFLGIVGLHGPGAVRSQRPREGPKPPLPPPPPPPKRSPEIIIRVTDEASGPLARALEGIQTRAQALDAQARREGMDSPWPR